jgi:nitrogen fixation/metabolism regulation signal transduction histidine kinase
MLFKSFTVQCTFRILLIISTLSVTFYLTLIAKIYISSLLLCIFAIFQIYHLIYWVTQMNQKVQHFVESIYYQDFSVQLPSNVQDAGFGELHKTLNALLTTFHAARYEKEERAKFLDFLLDNVATGILVFDEMGKIQVCNRAASMMLGITSEGNIQSLQKTDAELYPKLRNQERNSSFTHSIKTDFQFFQISGNSQTFISGEQKLTLITFRNISAQLAQKELDTWQNLMKVLTHEVMNSLTPIISLAETSQQMMKMDWDEEMQHELQEAIATIERRGNGLLNFVTAFRSFSRIPQPEKKHFEIVSLLANIQRLIAPKLQAQKVAFSYKIEPQNLSLFADFQQMEQVLLNLCYNAIDALTETENPKIEVNAELDFSGNALITVSDNGEGIPDALQEKIFIPFFTTKVNGSGIGLPLSKQIIHLHGGMLFVKSAEGEGTTFYINMW